MKLVLLLALTTVPALRADILFSNLGPQFPTVDTGYELTRIAATPFTATASGGLSYVELSTGTDLDPHTIDAGLFTNGSNNLPDVLLENWTFTVPKIDESNPFSSPVEFLASVLNPTITRNDTYWLVLNPEGSIDVKWYTDGNIDTEGVWSGSSISSLTQLFATQFAAPGVQLATPEPATIGLAAFALLLLSTSRRIVLRNRG